MVYSFLGVSLLSLAVVTAMAEMCSMYPVAGGQYSWVAVLAPPKIARGLSYVAGWFMIIGMLLVFFFSQSRCHAYFHQVLLPRVQQIIASQPTSS